MTSEKQIVGYLPDERPPAFELILFALQQIVVMFPATVLVALITGFHVSTTIFASGLSTLAFIFITRKKIPFYYGSSFSYIAPIASIMGAEALASASLNDKIAYAQFGIVLSGFVSIIAGMIINRSGKDTIDRILPPTVTGSVALIIGLSLSANAMSDAGSIPANISASQTDLASSMAWLIAIITLISTILYSIYLKGKLSQLPILFGLFTGYLSAAIIGQITGIPFITFDTIVSDSIFNIPTFTFPKANLAAAVAITPIAIATIPESTAHIFQLDLYVNDLAKKKKSNKKYNISDKLGLNLIGDGVGDIVSGIIGGPAGTNYGENISTMAVSKNFSVFVLIAAAIITMIISSFTPLINVIYSIPTPVIGGLSIYLFGIIAAQGIAIMMDRKVDMFSSKNLSVIAVILIIGLGGSFAYEGGMIPMFGTRLPAIATAAISGILLNFLLTLGDNKNKA